MQQVQITARALPINRYCEIYDEKKDAIMKRLQRNVWQHGVHAFKPKGCKCLWISIEAVEAWALAS